MRAPKATRLPSGSWYCRVRVNGKDVSITRSTEAEAIAEAMAVKVGIKETVCDVSALLKLTVSQAIDNYISARENVLSPSTVAFYRAIQRTRFRAVSTRRISEISQRQWQQIVNAEARKCSAKTLKNAWGFMHSVIVEATDQQITVRLPQVVEKDKPFLDQDQIPKFVEAVKGTEVEIPALLGLSSLRRSEILALRWENVNLVKGTISVDGAAVIGPDGKLVQKETNKNSTSKRVIPIIAPLRETLENVPVKKGLVADIPPNAIYKRVNEICRQFDLPEIGVHGLRRSFASLAYHLGFSEEMMMRIGGWSDIYTMRKIYTKLSEKDIAEKSCVFTAFFEGENAEMTMKNDDKN